MKTLKDLNKMLVSKNPSICYTYRINSTKFEIHEFNSNKGWSINTYVKGSENSVHKDSWILVDSYGYNSLTLKECKNMIILNWNNNDIK